MPRPLNLIRPPMKCSRSLPRLAGIAAVLWASQHAAAQANFPPPEPVQLSKDAKYALVPGGAKIAISLAGEVAAIALLHSANGKPYALVSGAECEECDAGTSVYAFPAAASPRGMMERYTYPGDVTDYETGKLIQKSRMFSGRCVTAGSDGVIWFARFVADDGKWHRQTTALRFEEDSAKAYVVTDSRVTLAAVLRHVQEGGCKELPGVARNSEP